MNDEHDIEERLRRVALPAPAAELRERIMALVAQELHTEQPQSRRWGWAVAAALLLAIASSWLAGKAVDRRLAVYFPAEPKSSPHVRHDYREESADLELVALPWRQMASHRHEHHAEAYEKYLLELTELSTFNDAQQLP